MHKQLLADFPQGDNPGTHHHLHSIDEDQLPVLDFLLSDFHDSYRISFEIHLLCSILDHLLDFRF